jgi:hypothetical protein
MSVNDFLRNTNFTCVRVEYYDSNLITAGLFFLDNVFERL